MCVVGLQADTRLRNVTVIKLKGVYKHPDWNDTFGFINWAKKHNPTVLFHERQEYKVSVSMKVKKRRKLKKVIVTFEQTGCGDPRCCGDLLAVRFSTPLTPA